MRRTDQERINWLESMARGDGGLLLHAELNPTCRLGLGLARPNRSLRQAIDEAMNSDVHALGKSCN